MCKPEVILSDHADLPPIIIKTEVVTRPNLTDYGHVAGRYRAAAQTVQISLPRLEKFMRPL